MLMKNVRIDNATNATSEGLLAQIHVVLGRLLRSTVRTCAAVVEVACLARMVLAGEAQVTATRRRDATEANAPNHPKTRTLLSFT
jgi:hypothetical protein